MNQSPARRLASVLSGTRPLLSALLGVAILCAVIANVAPVAGAQTPIPSGVAQLAETLAREGTYVSPGLSAEVPFEVEAGLQHQLDTASLRGITLRLAVLDQTPSAYPQLDDFVNVLYSALGLPDSILVVATPHGLAAATSLLPRIEVEQQAALGRAILERDGYVKALQSVADSLVSDALALATPAPAGTLVGEAAQSADRVFAQRPDQGAAGLPLAALLLLAILAGGYIWLARRIWYQQLGTVLASQELVEARLAEGSHGANPRAVETARRSLATGTKALHALQPLPWWRKWLMPWAPPPQLRLADRAFGAALQLLGDSPELARPVSAEPAPPAPATRPDAVAPPPDATRPTTLSEDEPRPLRPTALRGVAAGDEPLSDGADETLRGTATLPDPAALHRPPAPATQSDTGATRTRWGWFGRKTEPVRPRAVASLNPEHILSGLRPEQPLACFFCGCPLRASQVQVGRVALAGQPLRPLLCARHAAALATDERPRVWARVVEGDAVVPWFRDPTYAPAWDYNPDVVEPVLAWDVLPPPDELLAEPLRVVVHANDPRWDDAASAGAVPATAESHDRAG